MALQYVPYRFTVDDYNRMAEAGILREDARVELIEGEIRMMSPIGARHAGTVDRSDRALKWRLGDGYIVRVQGPILLDDYSEPQPDLAVLRFRDDYYTKGHPTPADILLVVEVADSTLEEDRKVKMPLHARAGIPEAWLVDLKTETVVRYAAPREGRYRLVRRLRRGQELVAAAIPGLRIPVAAIVG
jgi:Uma2 family endonuclease